MTVRKVFKTPGPLYDKVREITDSAGKNTVLLRFGYDETGRLIRKIDNTGFITTYIYDASGKVSKQVVLPPSDPATVAKLQVKEKSLLGNITSAKTPTDKDRAIEQLALFYIYQMGETDKALDLVKDMAHPSWAFNIEMHAILGNRNLTSVERVTRLQALLTKFPDEKAELSVPISIFQRTNG